MIFKCIALRKCLDIEAVVKLINASPILEGVEGIEFSANDLSAQYAFNAALDSDYPIDESQLMAHLDFLKEAGAIFEYQSALESALIINNSNTRDNCK